MNHFISLTSAKQMTGTFRQNRESVLKDEYQKIDLLPICETFDRDAFDQILAQTGCTFIRIYYGMDSDLKVHSIVVGVDENDNDILNNPDGAKIADQANRCPDLCPVNLL